MKTQLIDLDKADLLKLVGDLFKLSSENAQFLGTRFSSSSSDLLVYKKIISEALYEKALKSDKVDFRTAKKAISNYRKARGSDEGLAELMVFYVERANQFSMEMGDMWEGFYTSVESMYQSTVDLLLKQRKKGENIESFRCRLESVMKSTSDMGWGHYDVLSDIYYAELGEMSE